VTIKKIMINSDKKEKNMKKLISILLAICILLTFVACGSKPAANTDSEKQETVEKEDVVLND